ncbi:MAG: putative DNA-binding transcriptional regulator, partial [Desulfovibrionales bacterium]|nr:putative DNA-binding transcriptional regulator [Desulfovibrionales bacterium]
MSYTTAQLAEALGIKPQSVDYRVKKEGWQFQRRKGKGGGRLFTLPNLPQDVRDAVLAWELKASSPALAETPLPPAVKTPVDTSLLTTKQRGVMCARLAFVREIDRLAATGLAKTVIMDNLVEAWTPPARCPCSASRSWWRISRNWGGCRRESHLPRTTSRGCAS